MSDLISRQAAIDALAKIVPYAIFDESTESYTNGLTDAYNLICQLPPAQPEPSIPLSWIEEHIEWLKSLDNEFASLAAAHISLMVKKWRSEQDE